MGRWHDFEPLQEAACGTPAGANRHRELGEDVCASCMRGLARYRRQLRADDRGGVEMRLDCDDLDFPNQYETPRTRPAPDPEWADQAACIGKPVDWWFPDSAALTPEAKAICDICPVQIECLRHAVRHNEAHGIWGGRSERARARLRSASRGAA